MKYRHREYTVPADPAITPAPTEVARVESILRRLVADTISEGYAAGEGAPAIRTAAQEIVGGAYLPTAAKPAAPAPDKRLAPVQRESGRPAGMVAWAEHAEAHKNGYEKRWPGLQSAERIAERGGFGYWEMTGFLGHEPKTWVPIMTAHDSPENLRLKSQMEAFEDSKFKPCACGHFGHRHSFPNLGRCYGGTLCQCREFKPKEST